MSVGDRVGRENNGGKDSDFGAEFVNCYSEGFEVEAENEVCYGDGSSVNNDAKDAGDEFGEVFEL